MTRDAREERHSIKADSKSHAEEPDASAATLEKTAERLSRIAEQHPKTADRVAALSHDLRELADILDRDGGAGDEQAAQSSLPFRRNSRPMGYARAQATAVAALSMCEALALSLAEDQVLDPEEIRGAFEDAVESHRNSGGSDLDPAIHDWAAQLIEYIASGFNRIRNRQFGN